MKKKIIFVLSVLFAAMLLTGCAKTITTAEINEMDDVANEIAANRSGYQLPEGYEVEYSDATNTGRIKIICEDVVENIIYAEYEIFNGTAERMSIRIDGNEAHKFWKALIGVIALCMVPVVLGHRH